MSEIVLLHSGQPLGLWLPSPKTEEKDRTMLAQLKEAAQNGNERLAIELVPQILNIEIDEKYAPSGPFGASSLPVSVLEIAITNDMSDLISLLMEAGANPNRGFSLAVGQSRTDMVKLLLDAGANPTSGLSGAVKNDDPKMVELLLEAGANPSPGLSAAIEKNNPQILELLLKAGADPNHPVIGNYGPPLALPLSREIAKLFIDYGADVNHQADQAAEYLLIHKAIDEEWVDHVKLLLEAGADPNAKCFGFHPLQGAMNSGNQEIIDLLLAAGAEMPPPPPPSEK